MIRNSIKCKIVLIASVFLLVFITILLSIAHFQLKEIISDSQKIVYRDKVNNILSLLQGQYKALQTIENADNDNYKNSVIHSLRNTFYSTEKKIYPFIINLKGEIILHPVLKSGDNSLADKEFIQKAILVKNGNFVYTYETGEEKWLLFKYFGKWEWIIGYAVPLSEMYKGALIFRTRLVLIFLFMLVPAIYILYLFILKVTSPITDLSKASKAVAGGDLNYSVDIKSRDEVGFLAGNFIKMQQSIRSKINLLNNEIKKRKKSEELVQIFKRLSEASTQGIVMTDFKGVITYANHAFCYFLKKKYPGEIIGNSITDYFISETAQYLNESIFADIVKIEEKTIESQICIPENNEIPVILSFFIVNDNSGKPYCFAATITDISKQKEAEGEIQNKNNQLRAANEELQAAMEQLTAANEELQATMEELYSQNIAMQKFQEKLAISENRFRSLVETTNDWIWEVDSSNKYVYVSPRVKELLGYTAEEVLGRTLFDLMEGKEAERISNIFTECIKQKLPIKNLENVNIHKNGHLVILETNGLPVLNAKNEVLGYRGIDRDITERKKAQELMIQSEKMMTIGGLAAGMAHEINNPLGVIVQGVQSIERRISPEMPHNIQVATELGVDLKLINQFFEKNEISKYLFGIEEAGIRAANIIKNMLQFSRKSSFRKQYLDINYLIDNTIEIASKDYDLKKKYDFRNILIVKEYDKELPPVYCIMTEIEQVILNILKNSAQAITEIEKKGYMPKIIVRTRGETQSIIIEIEDNGSGINENYKRHIFEPFYTTKEIGQGTGLGLSVSYSIITNNHNGKIDFKSVPGKGTIFIINLPVK